MSSFLFCSILMMACRCYRCDDVCVGKRGVVFRTDKVLSSSLCVVVHEAATKRSI